MGTASHIPVGTVLMAVMVAASPVGGASGPAADVPQVRAPVVAMLDLRPQSALASGEVLRALAGTKLVLVVVGEVGARPVWQLGYEETVIGEGAIELDGDGTGRTALVLPHVRHRTPCRLLVTAGAEATSRRLVIFPSSSLSASRQRIAEQRFGVLDARGRVQAALDEEGVAFEDLATESARRFFDGGAVILAGYEQPGTLAAACRWFEQRTREGLFLVLLNPPPGWEGCGLKRAGLAPRRPTPARLAKDFRQTLRAVDLGEGPWQDCLETEGPARRLIWFKDSPGAEKKQEGPRGERIHALAAARAVGRGWLVAAALPALEDPRSDPVGRGILNELILWVTRVRDARTTGRRSESCLED